MFTLSLLGMQVPWYIALCVAMFAWGIWIGIVIRPHITAYFAKRRQIRRLRQYARYDIEQTRKAFNHGHRSNS